MSFPGFRKRFPNAFEMQAHSTPSSLKHSTPSFFTIFPQNDESGYFSYACKERKASPKRCFDDLMDWEDDIPVPKRLSFSNLVDFSFSEADMSTDYLETPRHGKKRRPMESTRESMCHIDFLTELQKRNCSHIISNVLSYLSDRDICAASCVSTCWRNAVSSDATASNKKQNFLKKKEREMEEKENKHKNDVKLPHYGLLVDIQNIKPEPDPVIFLPFQEVDEALPRRQFLKCPRCFSPAVVDRTRCRCIRKLCQYEFLHPSACSYEAPELFSNDHDRCLSVTICSKRNKKNLRRL